MLATYGGALLRKAVMEGFPEDSRWKIRKGQYSWEATLVTPGGTVVQGRVYTFMRWAAAVEFVTGHRPIQ